MTYGDLDDLLGNGAPLSTTPPVTAGAAKRGRGRPRGSIKKQAVVEITSTTNGNAQVSLEVADIHAGVTVSWLAAVFGMHRDTVKKRVADCPLIRKERNDRLYNLRQVVAYLVEPKVDIGDYIKNMRPTDLPPTLQKDYWDAMNKRLKYLEDSGDLWRTVDVLETLGEAFKKIKTTVLLWPDQVERVHGLNDDQRKALTAAADGLLAELHEALVQMPNERVTASIQSELHEQPDRVADEV